MERSTGINTRNANEYVATFLASEQAEGHDRVIQIISITSGKIDESFSSPSRTVSSDDSLDISTVSGNVVVGDNAYFACYVKHSKDRGNCLITPILCDNEGKAIGILPPKKSEVLLTLYSGSSYFSPCLSWDVKDTGCWKVFPHVSGLSDGDIVDIWVFTF
jgi:hypothetical protein